MEVVGILALSVLMLAGLVWLLGGRTCSPTDEDRYYFNGQPDRCIECGRRLLLTRMWRASGETITMLRCPLYSGPQSAHEFYRWVE